MFISIASDEVIVATKACVVLPEVSLLSAAFISSSWICLTEMVAHHLTISLNWNDDDLFVSSVDQKSSKLSLWTEKET